MKTTKRLTKAQMNNKNCHHVVPRKFNIDELAPDGFGPTNQPSFATECNEARQKLVQSNLPKRLSQKWLLVVIGLSIGTIAWACYLFNF